MVLSWSWAPCRLGALLEVPWRMQYVDMVGKRKVPYTQSFGSTDGFGVLCGLQCVSCVFQFDTSIAIICSEFSLLPSCILMGQSPMMVGTVPTSLQQILLQTALLGMMLGVHHHHLMRPSKLSRMTTGMLLVTGRTFVPEVPSETYLFHQMLSNRGVPSIEVEPSSCSGHTSLRHFFLQRRRKFAAAPPPRAKLTCTWSGLLGAESGKADVCTTILAFGAEKHFCQHVFFGFRVSSRLRHRFRFATRFASSCFALMYEPAHIRCHARPGQCDTCIVNTNERGNVLARRLDLPSIVDTSCPEDQRQAAC